MSDGSGNESDNAKNPATESWDGTTPIEDKYTEPSEPEFDIEPTAPDPSGPQNVDSDIQAKFWALVLIFNVALLCVSVGAMFAVIQGNYTFGSRLFLGGAVLFAYGVYRYRNAKQAIDDQNG